MNTGKPFSIVYITYDMAKGAGGVVKEIALATKHYQRTSSTNHKPAAYVSSITSRNPNHFSNSTTNIRIPGAGNANIRKVHIQLIRIFNGAIVK